MGLTVRDNQGRSHRTALVVDVSEFDQARSDYPERVKRLVQSVNGPNIKCDLFALQDGVLTRVSSANDIIEIAEGGTSMQTGTSSIRDWASQQGYTQVLIDQPTG